jgi:hypothetical protein
MATHIDELPSDVQFRVNSRITARRANLKKPYTRPSTSVLLNLQICTTKRASIELQNVVFDKIYVPGSHPEDVASFTYNLDGILVAKEDSYTQLYADGGVETVCILPSIYVADGQTHKGLPVSAVEATILGAVFGLCDLLIANSQTADLAVSASIVGGGAMGIYPNGNTDQQRAIGLDPLLLPTYCVSSGAVNKTKFVKPIFDALWRTGGHAGKP